jgi:hypothetical protein
VRAFTGDGSSNDLHPFGNLYPAAVESSGPNGVIGAASDDASDGYGVVGIAGGSNGTGVYGYAMSTAGITFGIYGLSSSTAGTGVFGTAVAVSGTTNGVYGEAFSTDGSGVFGSAVATSGSNYGVYGQTYSTHGTGVYGSALATSGNAYGVYGRSDSIGGTAVYGYASSTSGSTYGVYGINESTNGEGVAGLANMNGDYTTAGVYGRSDGNYGFGVAGHAFYYGVGVGAWSYGGNLFEAFQGDYPGGTLEFYIDSDGNVFANGSYNNFKVSKLDGAAHAVTSIQSPEVWVEDFGRANLADSQAVVVIASDFAGVADLAAEYNVFLTPLGDSLGLYVSNMTATSFEVHEQNGGRSNIPFSYRIVARQAGSENVRLPVITLPASTQAPRQADNPSPSSSSQPTVEPRPANQGQGQQP